MNLYIFEDKIFEIQNHLIDFLCDNSDQIKFVRAVKTTGGIFNKKYEYAVDKNDEKLVGILRDLSESFIKDVESQETFGSEDLEMKLNHHYFFRIDETVRRKLVKSGIFLKWDNTEWYGLVYPTFYKNGKVIAETSEGSIKLIADEAEEQRIKNSAPDIYDKAEF